MNKETITKDQIIYDGEKKRQVREDYLLPSIMKSKSFLGFHGHGEHYADLKALPFLRNMNLMSIDSDPIIGATLTAPDTKFTTLRDYCASVGTNLPENKRFGTIWLDYCGSYKKGYDVNNDLRALPNIMRKKGELWITLLKGKEGSGRVRDDKELREYEYAGLRKGSTREQIEQWMFSHIYPIMARVGVLVKAKDRLDYGSIVTIEGRERRKNGATPMMVYKITWERLSAPTNRPYMFNGVKVIDLDVIN